MTCRFLLTVPPSPFILRVMQQMEPLLVHTGQVISVIGGTSEARTVVRWMAASGVIPKSAPGRDGAGRADLTRRDVAMIVLGMAAPVARRAPEYARELAQLIGLDDWRTLVDIIADGMADHERLTVSEVWLPSYEGGARSAKVVLITDEGVKERYFVDMRVDETEVLRFFEWPEPAPPLARWQFVDGALLIRLAKLFVEREGATVPLAVVEDTAA